MVTGSTATLTFSSTAADLASFECRLDAGAYTACTSPKDYSNIGDGTHTVAVRAVDDVGNTGDPAERTFTVDTTAAAVTVDPVAVSGSTATVTFSSPADDVARFECRLDTDTYATCTSPHQLTGLAAGAHTVAVRAIDGTGNVGPAATREFTIADSPAPGGDAPPAQPTPPADSGGVLPSGDDPTRTPARPRSSSARAGWPLCGAPRSGSPARRTR